MKQHLYRVIAFVAVFAAPAAARAAVIMEQPVRFYRSASDSPYFAQLQSGEAYLNDFEDNDGYWWVNQAGDTVFTEYEVSQRDGLFEMKTEFSREASTGTVVGPGSENASVDGDDHNVEGWDFGGRGLTGDGFSSTPSLDIYFATQTHTTYPLWVGFVMTISGVGGLVPPAPQVDLLGIGGNVIGSFSLFDVRASMVADSQLGQPAHDFKVFNDRLIVFHSDEPIVRIKIYNATVYDHVQWGYTTVYVPEPGSAALALLAGAALLRRRRMR